MGQFQFNSKQIDFFQHIKVEYYPKKESKMLETYLPSFNKLLLYQATNKYKL